VFAAPHGYTRADSGAERRGYPPHAGWAGAYPPMMAHPVVVIPPEVNEAVPVARDLVDWLADGGKDVMMKRLADDFGEERGIRVRYESPRPGAGMFVVSGPGHAHMVVMHAASMLRVHLSHQERILFEEREAERSLRDLEAAEHELQTGLRAEFRVPSEVLGLVIGKSGANIERARQESGVERIRTEDDGMVRIRGPTAASVAMARSLLEYTVEELKVSRDQALRLKANAGARLEEMRRDTKVVRIEASVSDDRDEPSTVKVTGLRDAVFACVVMIRRELEYLALQDRMRQERREVERQLQDLDRAFGDAPYGGRGRGRGGDGRGRGDGRGDGRGRGRGDDGRRGGDGRGRGLSDRRGPSDGRLSGASASRPVPAAPPGSVPAASGSKKKPVVVPKGGPEASSTKKPTTAVPPKVGVGASSTSKPVPAIPVPAVTAPPVSEGDGAAKKKRRNKKKASAEAASAPPPAVVPKGGPEASSTKKPTTAVPPKVGVGASSTSKPVPAVPATAVTAPPVSEGDGAAKKKRKNNKNRADATPPAGDAAKPPVAVASTGEIAPAAPSSAKKKKKNNKRKEEEASPPA
jgi:hypothetical protein